VSRPSPRVIRLVRERAGECCEYCRFPAAHSGLPFQIDHIVARKHEGTSDESNLALACLFCNSAKGPSIAGIDPVSGAVVRLFHPRRDVWSEHFEWHGGWLRGHSPEGRATIQVLPINVASAVAVRESLIDEGIALE